MWGFILQLANLSHLELAFWINRACFFKALCLPVGRMSAYIPLQRLSFVQCHLKFMAEKEIEAAHNALLQLLSGRHLNLTDAYYSLWNPWVCRCQPEYATEWPHQSILDSINAQDGRGKDSQDATPRSMLVYLCILSRYLATCRHRDKCKYTLANGHWSGEQASTDIRSLRLSCSHLHTSSFLRRNVSKHVHLVSELKLLSRRQRLWSVF